MIGSEICCLPSKYFTLRLPRIHTKKRGTWGLFLKSPETFGVSFGCHYSLISSQRRGSKPSNFAVLLIFLTLKTCKKIIFSKQADCSLTTSFSGPKSSRDFRETGPSWSQDLKIPVSRPEMNLTVFDLDHVNQWLAYSAFLVLSMIFVFKRITDMETGCYRMTGLKSLFSSLRY